MIGTSRHIFGEDGHCVWCGKTKAETRTYNCPACPYDSGMAYLEEVGE